MKPIEFDFVKDGEGIGICRMPGRKRWALYSRTGNGYLPLAYFTSTDLAERARQLLIRLGHSPPAVEGADDDT